MNAVEVKTSTPQERNEPVVGSAWTMGLERDMLYYTQATNVCYQVHITVTARACHQVRSRVAKSGSGSVGRCCRLGKHTYTLWNLERASHGGASIFGMKRRSPNRPRSNNNNNVSFRKFGSEPDSAWGRQTGGRGRQITG